MDLSRQDEILIRSAKVGWRIDLAFLKARHKSLDTTVTHLLTKYHCDSTAKLHKKALARALSISGWPCGGKKNAPKMDIATCEFMGDPLVSDYSLANRTARKCTGVKNMHNGAVKNSGRLVSEYSIQPDVGRVYDKGFKFTNLAKELRPALLPEKGQMLWKLDADRFEMWSLAILSDDKILIDSLRAEDVHRATAAKVFGVLYDEVTEVQRAGGKLINFAILFGATAFFVARELGCSVHEAQRLIDSFYEAYPDASRFIEQTKFTGVHDNYSVTGFGTKRILSDRESKEKSAVSHAIQSTAAEVVRYALDVVEDGLIQMGGSLKGLLFDEYLVSLPKLVTEEQVQELGHKIEESFAEIGYPMTLSVKGPMVHWE